MRTVRWAKDQFDVLFEQAFMNPFTDGLSELNNIPRIGDFNEVHEFSLLLFVWLNNYNLSRIE